MHTVFAMMGSERKHLAHLPTLPTPHHLFVFGSLCKILSTFASYGYEKEPTFCLCGLQRLAP